jgi:transposase
MYIGVDTPKQTHTLAAIDAHGRSLGTRAIANTPEGWASGLAWAREWAGLPTWGIENSGSLGKGFAQFLLSQGEVAVCEVSPHRTAQYRRRGRTQDKTDQTDALAIARLLLAEGEELPHVQQGDLSTELRLVSDHRDNLVTERTRLLNQLHAQMLQLDPSYRERSGPLTKPRGLAYCRTYQVADPSGVVQARLLIVAQLVDQVERLDADIAALSTRLDHLVRASRTPLLTVRGVGVVVAARLLGELGSTPRVASAAALAALSGVAPVAVSSGNRQAHRLNRGGNRQLNRAIHIIALAQRRGDERAQAYFAKKVGEGKTKKAAMRCLKRRLVDVLFCILHHTDNTRSAAA